MVFTKLVQTCYPGNLFKIEFIERGQPDSGVVKNLFFFYFLMKFLSGLTVEANTAQCLKVTRSSQDFYFQGIFILFFYKLVKLSGLKLLNYFLNKIRDNFDHLQPFVKIFMKTINNFFISELNND